MERGLYEVKIERMNMFYDKWLGTEFEYIFVNSYKAFKEWHDKKYDESDVYRISYKKVSDDIMVMN